jgi:hypothetical protein
MERALTKVTAAAVTKLWVIMWVSFMEVRFQPA